MAKLSSPDKESRFIKVLASSSINVSFPPKDESLLLRVLETCPDNVNLAEHGRSLMQQALDATVANPRKRK